MNENQNSEKPEWFQMVDRDTPSAQVTKVNKKLSVMSLLAVGVVIAGGAFFANASENGADAATSVASPQSQATTLATSSPTATPASPEKSAMPAAPSISNGGVQRGDGDGDRDGRRGHDGDHNRGGDRDGDHQGGEGHDFAGDDD